MEALTRTRATDTVTVTRVTEWADSPMARWKALTLILLLVSGSWATSAWAEGASNGGVGTEFLLSAGLTVLVALAHGYSRGVDRRVGVVEGRVTLVEHEYKQVQSQISMMRESLPVNYHNKTEIGIMKADSARHTAEHRERVESALRDMTDALRHLGNRLDSLQRQSHRSTDD